MARPATPPPPQDETPAEVSAGSSPQLEGAEKRPWPSDRTLYSVPSLFLGKNSMTHTPTPTAFSIPVEGRILSRQMPTRTSNTLRT